MTAANQLNRERFDLVDGVTVRSLRSEPAGTPEVEVVIVPGLGAPGYLTRFAEELTRRGARSSILDVPGFGSGGGLCCPADITAMAALSARWVDQVATRPVLLVGHSTGAQAALRVAAQSPTWLTGLVLAGPTFAPQHRRLSRLLRPALLAFRRDVPTELRVVQDFVRANTSLLRLLRSALVDRPEEWIGAVRAPVLLTAGQADELAPQPWLLQLQAAATRSSFPAVLRLPGSHNNPWTHADNLARAALSVVWTSS